MPAEQKEIYYLIGESRAMIEQSPYLEAFKAKGQEVLLLTDPVDEYLVASLHAYKDKPLKAADRGKPEEDKESEEKLKAETMMFAGHGSIRWPDGLVMWTAALPVATSVLGSPCTNGRSSGYSAL